MAWADTTRDYSMALALAVAPGSDVSGDEAALRAAEFGRSDDAHAPVAGTRSADLFTLLECPAGTHGIAVRWFVRRSRQSHRV